MQAMPGIPDEATVLILLGDHPLIPLSVLQEMSGDRSAPLAVLTMVPDDPAGYGRVVRDHDREVSSPSSKIVTRHRSSSGFAKSTPES